jgi:hypothetical protein
LLAHADGDTVLVREKSEAVEIDVDEADRDALDAVAAADTVPDSV